VQFDRKFYGGSLRWMQPVYSVPGDLTLIGGLDFDQSQDSRHGYQQLCRQPTGRERRTGAR
jgi:iron complex outermembrane recepter protein